MDSEWVIERCCLLRPSPEIKQIVKGAGCAISRLFFLNPSEKEAGMGVRLKVVISAAAISQQGLFKTRQNCYPSTHWKRNAKIHIV